jgi:ATP-dependent DNA helicase RecG
VNLKDLLARGRGPTLEFVLEPDAHTLAEHIVAFANGAGGTIVVGVTDRGRVDPNAAELFEPVLGGALALCRPAFRAIDLPEWRVEEAPEGQVATITVRPTGYRMAAQDRVLVRSGKLNVEISPEQELRGRVEPELFSYEERAASGATLADLDQAIVDEYQRNRIRRGPRGEVVTRDELLREAGAVDAAGQVTTAGLLLFGKNPEYFLSQVGVVLVRFKGEAINAGALAAGERYARRVELTGPLARLVERTWQVLSEELRLESVANGLARQERYAYPVEAVREVVVNAFCHRDYAISGQRIEIRLFDDRMEVISPGGLPGHITLDNIVQEHYSRNPRLVRGLYYWGYIEELGLGMDIVYDAMRRDRHPEPELRATPRSFTVTLRCAVDQIEQQYGEDLGVRQLRALRYLASHGMITNSDYRELCPEVSVETVRLDLRDLVTRGILLRVGDKRGTYYVLK